MLLGKPDSHMQQNEADPYLTPDTKINSKWSKDLNIRGKTRKTFKESIAIVLYLGC